MMRSLLISVACAALLAIGGCGERPQVVNYKQGEYQGKLDTPPYNAAPYNGDRKAWENAIRARQQNQNEYKRAS